MSFFYLLNCNTLAPYLSSLYQLYCMLNKFVVPFIFSCLLAFTATAQDKLKIKYGKVDPEEFKKDRFDQDTGAHAIVLADIAFAVAVATSENNKA